MRISSRPFGISRSFVAFHWVGVALFTVEVLGILLLFGYLSG